MQDIQDIIDDIEAGLVDDPIEDYQYLKAEAANYSDHEMAKEIFMALGKMMYVDIPVMARKELKNDMTGDASAFNMMISEAKDMMVHGSWGIAAVIFENLIGDGIGFEDTDDIEFRTFDEAIQQSIYEKFMKPENKEVLQLPVNIGELYGLYGCTLIELKSYTDARAMLEISLHFNPMNFHSFSEYAETFKMQGDMVQYEKMNRDYLKYAYSAADIARLYRNLGYAYIEKKDYSTAVVLYQYSQAYDPEDKMAANELAFIADQTKSAIREYSQEEADAILTREGIQIGVADQILDRLYKEAYVASAVDHDVKKTEYFCHYLYDVTRNEKLVAELMETAKDPSKGFGFSGGSDVDPKDPKYKTVYERDREAFLQTIFPSFPKLEPCRLKMTFTLGSIKYNETILQIVSQLDEMSKLVEGKDVTVYFSSIKDVIENIDHLYEFLIIAGGWKSFRMSINETILDKEQIKYFISHLEETLEIKKGNITADDIRKHYKRLAAPKKAKKQDVDDVIDVNLKDCTPQEVVAGLASIYAKAYLSECDVKMIRVSDNEIVLSANDDLVVDFWVEPYPYGRVLCGEFDGMKPYEFCSYYIQELTKNNLFKYNASAFRRIFWGVELDLQSLTYNGPDYYVPEINHFHKIDKAYPELHLMEKVETSQGDPYAFIIFEMENADGSIGRAIGYTDKKPRTLLVKICKELETRTTAYLKGNGTPGLIFSYCMPFINAFLSWKGLTKTKRLEKHLRYYYFEKMLKDKSEAHEIAKTLITEANSGKHENIERKTYADIGRRK